MMLCVGIAITSRLMRKRNAARISFIFFIIFLLSAFATLLAYANKTVADKAPSERNER